MQAIRQSLTFTIQRSVIFTRSSLIIQQIRFNGSDPRTSTSSESHKNRRQSDSTRDSDLNKSKGSDKKQRSSTIDDTNQPGTTRKDWSEPDKVVGNVPPYGKGGGAINANNPNQGKK